MTDVKQLTCPNCGANITNTQNCEYCGSLLVRFVDKDIDISKTSYLDKSCLSEKLLKALKLDLSMQKSISGYEYVVVDIYQRKQYNDLNYYKYVGCVLQCGHAAFSDSVRIPSETSTGLCVIFVFDNYSNVELEKFKTLDCFPLFNERPCICHTDNEKVMEYFIDFGKDAEGAAQILTEITAKVYDVSEEELECYVHSGDGDDIEAARTKFNESANWFYGDWEEFKQNPDNFSAIDQFLNNRKKCRSFANSLLVAAFVMFGGFKKLDSWYYSLGEEWMWTMRCICLILAGLCLLVAILLYFRVFGVTEE